MNNNKSTEEITTISGSDGPTSVFLLSKPKKYSFRQRIQKKKYFMRKQWVEKHIGTENHSIMEVCEYIQNQYGFVEVGRDTYAYKEEYVQMRYDFLMRYAPELLGEYAKIPELAGHSQEDINAHLKEIENQQRMAQTIPTTDFDIKLRMFKKEMENGIIHITVEENYGHISGGASGSKRVLREYHKVYRNIYKYYGVTAEDIRNRSERYEALIRELSM